jgi:rhomboid family GlyGly-CTERM serine protease
MTSSAVVFFDFLQTLGDGLIWNRADIARGQIWRLGTGALVHLSAAHALANLTGLGLWWRLESLLPPQPESTRHRLLGMLAGAFGVGALLLLSDLSWYAGASGLVYGLFTYTALRGGARGWVLLALLLGLLVLSPRLIDHGVPVAVAAHWAGVALGAAAAAARRAQRWMRRWMRRRGRR